MFLLALSGPKAGELMATNAAFAGGAAILVGVLAIVSVVQYLLTRRHKAVPILCVVLLVLHPAWIIGVRGGDGGTLAAAVSALFALVCIVAVAFQSLATVGRVL